MNIVLLMMGGVGSRFGASVPKQYVEIDGKPVFSYILHALNESPAADKIIIVTAADWREYVQEWVEAHHEDKVYAVVQGGDTRSGSVFNGLKCAAEFAQDDDVIMMHDATHPYVDNEGMAEMIEAVHEFGGATLGQRQYDTCYRVGADDLLEEVIPRQFVVSGASPEAFRFGDIYRIYSESTTEELDSMTSAGALALANGIRMKVCTLHTLNLKITYPGDMKLLRELIHTEYFPEEK